MNLNFTILISLLWANVYAALADLSDEYEPKNEQYFFIIGARKLHELMLFSNKKHFRHHTPEFLKELKDSLKIAEFLDYGKKSHLLRELTSDDIENASDNVCMALGNYLKYIPERAFKRIKKECLQFMMRGMNIEQIHHIPVKLLEREFSTILTKSPNLQYYAEKQIKVISQYKSACRKLNSQSLKKLTRKQWNSLSNKCFADIPSLAQVDLSEKMDYIPKNMFAYISQSIHRGTLGALTEKHVSLFASKAESGLIFLDIRHLSKKGVAGLTSKMLFTFLKTMRKSLGRQKIDRKLRLGKLWKYMPDNIFSKIFVRRYIFTLAQAIHNDDFKYMNPIQINAIITVDPKVCNCIASDADFSRHTIEELKISAKCFANMPKRLQESILSSNARLDDNVLGKITSKHVKRWDLGLAQLNKLKGPNVDRIIANISRAVTSKYHACHAIKSIETLQEVSIFKKFTPKGCWENLGFDVKEHDIQRHPLLFAGRTNVLKHLVNGEKAKKLVPSFTEDQWLRLTKENGEECKFIKLATFRLIRGPTLTGFSASCVASLSFKDQLMPEEIQYMNEEAFSKVDKDNFGALKLCWLSNQQLEHLSVGVEESKMVSISPAFTITVLQGIGEDRLRFFPARLWSGIHSSLFAVFQDLVRFKEFPGQRMVYWKTDQIRSITPTLLYSLNADQATHIGTESQDLEAIKVFVKENLSKFSEPAKTVFTTRFGFETTNKNSSSNLSANMMSIFGLSLVCVLLL